jgi:hypothetical protein
MDTMETVIFWIAVIWGPSLLLMAYLLIPWRRASWLDHLSDDPANQAKPTDRG